MFDKLFKKSEKQEETITPYVNPYAKLPETSVQVQEEKPADKWYARTHTPKQIKARAKSKRARASRKRNRK